MRFFTWNSQGDFTAPAKIGIVTSLFLNHHCDVGFIQEGGVDKAEAVIPAGVKIYSGSQVGAKNERCTTYVLVRNNVINGGVHFDCFNAIGGGEAGRGAAAVRIGNVIFASWHSLAGKSNSDTSALLDECKKLRGVNTVIIGADFNAEPADIEIVIAGKATRRGQNNLYCQVFKSGMPTHHGSRGDSEFDFFVVLHDAFVGANNITVTAGAPSDHDPVILDITL